MNSKKIVKKNFVIMIKVMMIILSLLLVVSCVLGTEPNNTGTNNSGGIVDNGDDPVGPAPLTDEQKIEAVLKKVKITNDSFNVFKLGEDPSEDELKAIGKKIDTIFEDGNTASAWLGLSRKEGDDKLYLIAKDIEGTETVDTINFMANLSSLQKACEDITKKYRPGLDITHHLISPTGNTDLCFESVKDALEWRWQNMKKDFPISSTPLFFCSETLLWLTPQVRSFVDHQDLKMVCLCLTDLFLTVKADKADPEICFFNDGSDPRIIDWVLTFVKDNDIYSFKVGKYSVSAANNPEVDATYDGIYACSLLMLKLSSLVRLSLEKQLMDGGISANVASKKAKEYVKDFEPFKSNFTNLEGWDVYLTVGEMLEGVYTNGMNPLGTFRNTFKLTGDDAKEFWKQ